MYYIILFFLFHFHSLSLSKIHPLFFQKPPTSTIVRCWLASFLSQNFKFELFQLLLSIFLLSANVVDLQKTFWSFHLYLVIFPRSTAMILSLLSFPHCLIKTYKPMLSFSLLHCWPAESFQCCFFNCFAFYFVACWIISV